MFVFRHSWLFCLVFFGIGDCAFALDEVDYLRDVKPVLKERCFACHGGLKQEGGLRLDTASLMARGGDNGKAIVAGKASESLLVARVTAEDEAERMPPEADPLTAQQVAVLRAWIDAGANAPGNEQPQPDAREHWAFQKPVRPVVPDVANTAWVMNPVDAFIAAEHQRRGLVPLPPAEKHVLLRRIYLDLIGLPPTRSELDAFLADDTADAYEKVVDRLLESPHYGERWGRHWMDVWRYSDWYGRRTVPDALNSYGQIWRWRDWIVRSLNADKGYDRMIMEMLAADEIAPDDDDNIVATGFIVRNFYRWNYNTWMKDSVEHTGKAFLGLTLNCCHCHDHKYDPISNEEYFRFRAFFEPIEIRHDRVSGEPDPGPYPKYSYGAAYKPIATGLVRIMDEKLNAETFVYTGGESRNIIPNKLPVVPGAPAIVGGDRMEIVPIDLPAESWYPGLKPFVRVEAIAAAEADLAKMQSVLDAAKQLVAQAKDDTARRAAELTLRVDTANVARAETELAAVRARIRADQVRYQGHTGDPDETAKEASRWERRATLESARVEFARAERDSFNAVEKPREEQQKAEQRVAASRAAMDKAKQAIAVESVEYSPFSPKYPQRSSGRRTALARWIASNENPLTARVAVNHIWLRHFGRANVETTENLGSNGARPTHPQLLDWLAIELMENDWRMKDLHRLIVTSNVYRMSSSSKKNSNLSREVDRDNLYLWQFDSARMEAEVIRDSILFVSGQLDTTLGGKEIDQNLGLTVPRRSLYLEHHGEGRMKWLDLFDAADPCDCYRRTKSVRPQQALAMANSELGIRQGRLLARNLRRELGERVADDADDRERFVRAAFKQILTRMPNAAELTASVKFLQRQSELFQQTEPEELAAKSVDDPVPPSIDPMSRAEENLVQALFSHHDFVTIR